MTTKDFTKATQTRAGYKVKDITWNETANLYLGMVADPSWARPGREYTTASWKKSGKCGNSTRPDCDLVL